MSKHTTSFIHAGYHKISMRPDRMRKLRPVIRKILSKCEFDAIAFRGLSGALLAMPIAIVMDKSLIMVRKPEDKSHSNYLPVQCDLNTKRYIIVDDFKSSGATAQAICAAVKDYVPEAECLGVLEVNHLFDDNEECIKVDKAANYTLAPVEGAGDFS